MDLDFLPRIVVADINCDNPSAERALKTVLCLTNDWYYPPGTAKRSMAAFPKISDPAGLLRSLSSTYAAGHSAHYGHRASHVS